MIIDEQVFSCHLKILCSGQKKLDKTKGCFTSEQLSADKLICQGENAYIKPDG